METHASDRWVWILIATACAGVLALAIAQSQRHPGGTHRVEAAKARAISLPSLDGKPSPLPLDKVTLVDFWATWCAPCRATMPRIQKLFEEYQPKGFALYSVDTDDAGPSREPTVREFLLQQRLSFPVVLDDGSASEAFSIENLPTMVLLDKHGRVIWRHIGALNGGRERELREAIDKALASN